MPSIERLLRSGHATLSVYSPDAVRGGLINLLDQAIHQRLDCLPIRRAWVRFGEDTIESFYSNSIAQIIPNFYLINRLFTSGPSLATLWHGYEVLAKMPTIKGHRHPAQAALGTIRASFWCDNPVCSLIHVSDNLTELYRELDVLHEADTDLLNAYESLESLLLADNTPKPCHNGIRVLCEIVHRILSCSNEECALPPWCAAKDSRQTMEECDQWLRRVYPLLKPTLSDAISRFLIADISPKNLVVTLETVVQLTHWEHLLLRCAVIARKGWLQ